MQFTLPIISALTTGKGNLYKWTTPASSSATTGISGWAATAANTYVGVIGQPSNPRCLRYTFTAMWNGGNVTVNGTFDGQAISYVIPSAPGSTNVDIPTALFTTVTSITKSVVGTTGSVSIGYGDYLGVENNNINLEQFGVGVVNGAVVTLNNTSRADGRSALFGLSPNGARTFILSVNKA
jgi:hypothetical protein